jgi:hypothetical protein
MSQIAQNTVTPESLRANWGIDMNNATDRALLTQQISSAAVQARFPNFRIVNVNGTPTVPAVYNGFPASQQLIQALRGVPQWGGLGPWIGPPMGKTWYDSMQVTVTKRLSHGLQANVNFTWAKGQVIGSASDSTYFLGGQALATDIFNFNNNKQLNQYVRPLATTIAFTYTTPKITASGMAMKVLSHALGDWQIGPVLRFQSGALIGNPTSLNLLTNQLARNAQIFGPAGTNFWNLTGQPRWKISDPNCRCFNPQTDQVLNTGAWVDAPPGQWSTSAPFYNDFRWQRQPSEAVNFGRNIRFGRDGRFNFFIRAEFQNIFNRLFLSPPSLANPNLAVGRTAYAGNVLNNSGFGTITTLPGAFGAPTQVRTGQIVTRFTF